MVARVAADENNFVAFRLRIIIFATKKRWIIRGTFSGMGVFVFISYSLKSDNKRFRSEMNVIICPYHQIPRMEWSLEIQMEYHTTSKTPLQGPSYSK